MIAVGVIFDLLPILLLVGIIFWVIVSMGGSMEDVKHLSKSIEVYTGANESNWFDRIFDKAGALIVGGISGGSLAKGAVAGGLTAFFFGPFIYVVASFIASTLAYIFFTFWFLAKGVNIWAFGSFQRTLVNLSTIIVENVPIVDLFPGITVMVWRHITISRAEDKLKESELVHKVNKRLSMLAQAQS